MDSSQQGVSFFRIVLIGLLLASVWVVARRFVGNDRNVDQSAASEKKPALTFNGRPVSLTSTLKTDPNGGQNRERSLDSMETNSAETNSAETNSADSYSENSEQSYFAFLESVAKSLPSFDKTTLEIANESPAKDRPNDRTDNRSSDPVVAQSALPNQLDIGSSFETTDVPANDVASDPVAESKDELPINDETEPESPKISEVESTVAIRSSSAQVESSQPETTSAQGLVQPNPFTRSDSKELAAQTPNRSFKQNSRGQVPTSPSDRNPIGMRNQFPPSTHLPTDRRIAGVVSETAIPSADHYHGNQSNEVLWNPPHRVGIDNGASNRPGIGSDKFKLFSKIRDQCFLPKRN
jgi:hypothetical protein